MTSKHHINASERDQIGVLLAAGVSQRNIARKLGRSFSSINYEIRHNSQNGEYRPILANYLSRERNLASQRKHARKDPHLYDYVIDKLRCGWSPEQIAGRMRKHNHGQTVICPEQLAGVFGPKPQEEISQTLSKVLPARNTQQSQY